MDTAAVVLTTKAVYSNRWLVIFVNGNCLRRAWCALEIAVGTSSGCKLTVIGSCDIIKGKHFYEELQATVEKDIALIRTEIIQIFKSEKDFNEVVAQAMQTLFVVAQKSKKLPDMWPPRSQRAEWSSRMESKNPNIIPRDREQDWSIISGNASGASLRVTQHGLILFLSSIFSDTKLELNYAFQDVFEYVKECARNRGLDFNVSDMRFGNTHEESLPLEVRIAELERCAKESAGVFYVLVAGTMRGPTPAPARIPKAELESLLRLMDPEDSGSVRASYVLDENQLDSEGQSAPQYVLTEFEDMNRLDKEKTRTLLEVALRKAAMKLWPETAARCDYLSSVFDGLVSLTRCHLSQVPS